MRGTLAYVSGVDDYPARPAASALLPNAPNPFRAGTRIACELPAPAAVTREIFDISGRRVRTLLRGPRSARAFPP